MNSSKSKNNNDDHKFYMDKVLELAHSLLKADLEIPVAAIIVKDGKIIAEALNSREKKQSVIAHAEILAIEAAAKAIGDWNLDGSTIYVNLEPCPMCAGAILQSHINTVVYGANEPKSGAFGSRYNIKTKNLNIISGICEKESQKLLEKFFESK